MLLAGYLTLGVLLSNSQLSNLLVIMIWLVYWFRRFRVKDMVKSFAVIGIAFALVLSLGFYDFLAWKLSDAVQQMSVESIQSAAGNNFEEGKYERTAAIYYYLTQPMKVLGDGPSVYFNALSREFTLGNTSQIFTFYAETGIVGLAIGYLIFFVMSKQYGASGKMAWGCFLIISTLTITSFVLSDTSLMLSYCIFLKTNLVSEGEKNELQDLDYAILGSG